MSKFNLSQFFQPTFYPIAFFYLGMLTRLDDFSLTLPNVNMRQMFAQYFNELNHIDVETRYAEIMSAFINHPNLEQLFAGYWREYVSQLPDVIFQKMNENFYRTTFIEFKYYSNAEFKKFKTTLADFQLQAEDTEQINGYAVGLQQEFPRAHIECYVIYCVGNQGFRVFTVTHRG